MSLRSSHTPCPPEYTCSVPACGSGTAALDNHGINPDGPATLSGTAATGRGRVVAEAVDGDPGRARGQRSLERRGVDRVRAQHHDLDRCV